MGTELVTNIYIFVMAIVLAIVEIQIEGKDGWAKSLPTWTPSGLTAKLTHKLTGKKLTGYHLSLFPLVLLIFHIPYVRGVELTLTHWLTTISLFTMFIVLWDFLWFVLNPHYPLKDFSKANIPWHSNWKFGMPTDYIMGILASLLLALLIADGLNWWIFHFGLFVVETILVVLFSIFVLKIDHWSK